MTTGVLIYATDGDINYTKLATYASFCVEKHLNLPVTIVQGNSSVTSRRNWADCETSVLWKNSGRYNAVHDSPYDKTILLDADF